MSDVRQSADHTSTRLSAVETGRVPVDLLLRLGVYALVLYAALSVFLPFLWIVVWAVILAVMMYPPFDWLRRRTGGAGRFSAIVVTIVSLVLVLGPVALLCTSLVASLQQILSVVLSGAYTVPPVPNAIASLPVVGDALVDAWTLGGTNLVELLESHAHTLVVPGEWLLAMIASLAGVVLTLAVAVIVTGFLFVPGPRAVRIANAFAERVAGSRGRRFVAIAGETIRSVGRGVVGISLLQAMFLGAVLIVADVPHPGLLTFLALVLAIVQIGAIYVAAPITIWVWFTREPTEAIVFTAAVVAIATLEHVFKPIVMGRGLETPTLLLFLGLFGGVAVYGLAGIFIGPVVLAVCWELVRSWLAETPTMRRDALHTPPEGDAQPVVKAAGG